MMLQPSPISNRNQRTYIWPSSPGDQLVNPPKDVQLADVPTNIVPLTRMTASIQCKAKSDQPIGIRRQQVPVLPNFAMTDYARPGNITWVLPGVTEIW